MAKLGLARMGLIKDTSSTRAIRLADIYVKSHTAANGKVTDPGVYQEAIDKYLSPYADNLVVQNKVGTMTNTMKALQTAQDDIGNSVADLQLREHNSMYISEDGDGGASFRNPQYVANMASESLDALVASTAAVIDEKKAENKDTAALETYLGGLMKRADRMRNLSRDISTGKTGSLDGYGYYVDTDPNTGKVRGAAIAPTDVGSKDITDNMTRTDTLVGVGNLKVPVYLPAQKDVYGQQTIKFAGKTYSGDSNLLRADDNSDIMMSDKNTIPTDQDELSLGKLYKTFTGKNNVDGSPQQSYLYTGYDNKIYKLDPNNAKDKSFIDTIKNVNGNSYVPNLNPYSANKYSTYSIPDNDMGFATQPQAPAPASTPEQPVDQGTGEGFFSKAAKVAGGMAVSAISPALGAINVFGKPAEAVARTGADLIEKGKSFFRNLTK